ncbi:MAG: hypothetical protein WKF75_01595 [Singulisphaera sp.]
MPARVRSTVAIASHPRPLPGSTDPTASRGYDADRGGRSGDPQVDLRRRPGPQQGRRGPRSRGEGVVARARRLPGRIGGRCLVGPTPPLPHVSHPGWVTAGKRRHEVEPLYPSGLPLASGTSGGSAAGPRTEIASESSAGGRDG